MQIIDQFEKSQMRDDIPHIQIGDTVKIGKTIVEGKKSRIQYFQGTVIKMQGRLSTQSVTLRAVMDKIGVEKSFLLHSPSNKSIEVVVPGKVRRSKLYYLRDRVGTRATKIKTRELKDQKAKKA